MKAVLFDFDGTIIDSQPIIEQFLQDLFKQKNIQLNAAEKQAIQGMSIKDLAEWVYTHKHVELTPEEVTITDENYLEQIELFPGSKATLALIKAQGYKTALVTNSPRSYVNWLFHKYQLGHYFDVTYTEDEAIVPKPNPRMLRLACQSLQLPYHKAIMVDDSMPGIIAAKKLGMTTVKIGKEKEGALHVIEDVTQLPYLLEKIRFTLQ